MSLARTHWFTTRNGCYGRRCYGPVTVKDGPVRFGATWIELNRAHHVAVYMIKLHSLLSQSGIVVLEYLIAGCAGRHWPALGVDDGHATALSEARRVSLFVSVRFRSKSNISILCILDAVRAHMPIPAHRHAVSPISLPSTTTIFARSRLSFRASTKKLPKKNLTLPGSCHILWALLFGGPKMTTIPESLKGRTYTALDGSTQRWDDVPALERDLRRLAWIISASSAGSVAILAAVLFCL